jgi:sucrose-6-phosphatase
MKMAPFLIVTDLDSTLLGNDDALEEFNKIFKEHRQNYGSKLVYATGRSLKLYQDLESEVDLLPPDMLIASVGSEIYTADQQRDRNWINHLSANWDVESVKRIAGMYEELRPQPKSEQGPFKVSFFLSRKHEYILKQIEQNIDSENIKAQVIYSSYKDVDILPKQSGKGNALTYVRNALNMPCDRTLACGDSGNDIALFTEDTYGVIVGNAKPELKEWYEINKRKNLYLAQSDCAFGILEGLHRFGWL